MLLRATWRGRSWESGPSGPCRLGWGVLLELEVQRLAKGDSEVEGEGIKEGKGGCLSFFSVPTDIPTL